MRLMTWDVPTAEDCPECGQTMFKKSGRGRMKPFCVNEKCVNFLPEDQRGYYKKKTEGEEPAPEAEEKGKKPAKKATSKKTAAKKTATKSAAKKTTRKSTKKTEETGT